MVSGSIIAIVKQTFRRYLKIN